MDRGLWAWDTGSSRTVEVPLKTLGVKQSAGLHIPGVEAGLSIYLLGIRNQLVRHHVVKYEYAEARMQFSDA